MIQLQLSTEHSVVSEVIRVWTRAWCSHVDLVMPDLGSDYPQLAGKAGWLLGARSDGGVLLRPPGYAPFSQTEIVSFAATDTQAHAFVNYALLQLGKPYDHHAIAGLALDRNWRSPDQWFCSELAMACLEEAEIVHKITSPVNFISPRDILILAEAMQLDAVA
jgi:hypothetical protein